MKASMENQTSTEPLDPNAPETKPVPPVDTDPADVPVEQTNTVDADTGNGDMPPPGKP